MCNAIGFSFSYRIMCHFDGDTACMFVHLIKRIDAKVRSTPPLIKSPGPVAGSSLLMKCLP